MKLHPLTDHDCCPHCGGRLSAATATAGESDEDVYPCPACGRPVAHCLSPDGSCYLECLDEPWESGTCSGPPFQDRQLAEALRRAASLIPVLGTEPRLRVVGALAGALAAYAAASREQAQAKRPVPPDSLLLQIAALTECLRQVRS